jgi:hypothetical protein
VKPCTRVYVCVCAYFVQSNLLQEALIKYVQGPLGIDLPVDVTDMSDIHARIMANAIQSRTAPWQPFYIGEKYGAKAACFVAFVRKVATAEDAKAGSCIAQLNYPGIVH